MYDWIVCWWVRGNMNHVECDRDIVFSGKEISYWDWLRCALIRDLSRKKYLDSTSKLESCIWRLLSGVVRVE